ncbi:hypothetical protein CYY_001553 [Polysphondylium violaceum]|uniref:Uncharacterized protein n=1 Tax=Polysphondylium violaceum TaxID=133409 RepID=A0A8J4PZP5_9MYCE|nr:hypothetical protein CYY_001553 [Polysphondylium violaceum]
MITTIVRHNQRVLHPSTLLNRLLLHTRSSSCLNQPPSASFTTTTKSTTTTKRKRTTKKDKELEKEEDSNNNNNNSTSNAYELSDDLKSMGIYLPGQKPEEVSPFSQQPIESQSILELLDQPEHQLSFEQIQVNLEQRLQNTFTEKRDIVSKITRDDFIFKDQEGVDLYTKVSDQFIPADAIVNHENPILLKNEDTVEPTRDNISARLSKIKQRISKEKLKTGRLSGDKIENLFSLYREDPIKNSVDSLSKQFDVDPKVLENVFKYATVPIVVKLNTGLKTAHWNVIFEK